MGRTESSSGAIPSDAPGGAAGGELAGTFPNPTVAATHSGSAHADLVAKTGGGLEAVTAVGNSGATKTLDISAGNLLTVTNSESCTYTMPSSLTSGVAISFTLIVTNDGAYTATFTGVKWAGGVAPVLTSGASKVDIFTFITIDGGTTWYGFRAGAAMA